MTKDANVNGAAAESGLATYDAFPIPTAISQSIAPAQYNPYAEEHNNITGSNAGFYQHQAGYSAPLQPVSPV
jgi:hypothetical protein